MDAQGFYGGLVTGWNDNFEATNYVCLIYRIMVEGRVKGVGKKFKIVNLYAPYNNRLQF